ncbi:hypothetical protein [Nocardia aurea]|uniref:hypothetical protein n=1 Tax=Nocardia aurea TaxID=2144174 RepID=UPI00339F48BF
MTDDAMTRLHALLDEMHDVISESLDLPPRNRSAPRHYPKSPWAAYREFEQRDQSGYTLASLPPQRGRRIR